MTTILLFGAGKSATCLIDYLAKCCDEKKWKLIVCDSDLSLAQAKTKNFSSAIAISFDVTDDKKRQEFISKATMVITMLPPALHFLVAQDCVAFSKNLLTASYIDEKIKSLKEQVEEKEILFLGEMGLDPGIDHMSAMRMIDEIKNKGGKITSFKSHCGGLVSPQSDDNPWHYKITWNPANVVMAGSSGAVYLKEGQKIKIPYSEIFDGKNNIVGIPTLFPLAWYANRDSLSYIETYQLQNVKSFIRTTLRYPSFCRGWNKIIKLDLTSKADHEEIKGCNTFKDWFDLKREIFFSKAHKEVNQKNFFNPEFLQQIDYLGLNKDEKISFDISNSASLLQYLLEKKLLMKPDDKDMIIMLHEIEYSIQGENNKTKSCLIVTGENEAYTAMAKTVGLPLAIAAKLILENKIQLTGLHIPVIPEIYEPVLKELELYGIQFHEQTA